VQPLPGLIANPADATAMVHFNPKCIFKRTSWAQYFHKTKIHQQPNQQLLKYVPHGGNSVV
jgi:hypothetical protein